MVAVPTPKFDLGRTVATPAALEAIAASGQSPAQFLDRHVCGDWGEVSQFDGQANEDALRDGDRILSVYKTTAGVRLYVLTEGDRSRTTVLLPEEY